MDIAGARTVVETAHPVPIRVPGDHPSAGVPSEYLRDPRRTAVTRTGCCHSDGRQALGWVAPTPLGASHLVWSETVRRGS